MQCTASTPCAVQTDRQADRQTESYTDTQTEAGRQVYLDQVIGAVQVFKDRTLVDGFGQAPDLVVAHYELSEG